MLLGPEGRAEACPGAEDTAARLLSRGEEELARTLISAVARAEDRSTVLWLLLQGFHLVSHKRQCELVLYGIRGFAALPVTEQAQAFSVIAPRVRLARQGWRQSKPQVVYVCDSEAEQSSSVPPFVGSHGRLEADHAIVDMLDALEIALRRIKRSERKRLFRRLDKGVSENFTPVGFARLLAELPSQEVQALETWLVDEDALSERAAHQLLSSLLQAAAANDAVVGVGERIAEGAESLTGLAEDGADNIRAWLRGEKLAPGSPRSVCGDMPSCSASIAETSSVVGSHNGTKPPRLKVITKAALMARSLAAEAERQRNAGLEVGSRAIESQSQSGYAQTSKRGSCQLHCPAATFLWTGASQPKQPPVHRTSASGNRSLGEQFGL